MCAPPTFLLSVRKSRLAWSPGGFSVAWCGWQATNAITPLLPLLLSVCTGNTSQGPRWQGMSKAPSQGNLFRGSVRSETVSTQTSVQKCLAPVPQSVTVFRDRAFQIRSLGAHLHPAIASCSTRRGEALETKYTQMCYLGAVKGPLRQ